jgi:integrase
MAPPDAQSLVPLDARSGALGALPTAPAARLPLYLLRFDRPNTRRAYTQDLAAFFGTETIPLELARAVSFADVNAFIERLERDGASTATIRRRVAALRGFFSWLVALGALSLNPADRQLVRRIASERSADRTLTVLTREQARRLVESVDLEKPTGYRDQTLILTLLHCVLRRSEAAGMNFEHIRELAGHTVLDLPRAKGGANQIVKIPPHVRALIQNMKQVYGIVGGPIWRSMSRNQSSGNRLSSTSIYMIVNRAASACGIQGQIGAHTLRHTGCTLAIEGGASIQQVQSHARHKSIETTMMYVHQRDRLANNAADFIDL